MAHPTLNTLLSTPISGNAYHDWDLATNLLAISADRTLPIPDRLAALMHLECEVYGMDRDLITEDSLKSAEATWAEMRG
jgi:hypothetical protein